MKLKIKDFQQNLLVRNAYNWGLVLLVMRRKIVNCKLLTVDCRENKKIIFGLLFMIFAFSTVSAQIIGGEVFTEGYLNPSWQMVFVYDVNDVGNYREVLVSPDQYRYSFVNTKLNDRVPFPENSIVRAEILDFLNGVMAGHVDMLLSSDNSQYYLCSDCDIFSRMEFREVVQINEPSRKLYISEDGSFDIEVNVYDDCDFFILRENFSEMLCENGCDLEIGSWELEIEGWGLKKLEFVTDCHTGKREKRGSRDMIFPDDSEKSVSFEKTLEMSIEYNVQNMEYEINFYGTKSDGTFSITDFIPDEYEVFNVSRQWVVF